MNKKIMSNEENAVEKGSADVQVGSPGTQNANLDGPAEIPAGEPKSDVNLEDYIPKDQYEGLEKKLGEQGLEVGKLRDFFNEISPLLEKLQGQDDLVDAILTDKLDSKTVNAILSGEVKLDDATAVAKAHEEVKKDVGVKKYDKMSSDDVEKLVTDKVNEIVSATKSDLKKDITDIEDKRDFEDTINKFIENTEDYGEYADDISKWLEDHEDIYDIETAYMAVKGKRATEEMKDKNAKDAAEAAKKVAGNAGGGQSQGGAIHAGPEAVDALISKKSSPNLF